MIDFCPSIPVDFKKLIILALQFLTFCSSRLPPTLKVDPYGKHQDAAYANDEPSAIPQGKQGFGEERRAHDHNLSSRSHGDSKIPTHQPMLHRPWGCVQCIIPDGIVLRPIDATWLRPNLRVGLTAPLPHNVAQHTQPLDLQLHHVAGAEPAADVLRPKLQDAP